MNKIQSVKLTSDIGNIGILMSFLIECAQGQAMEPEKTRKFQLVIEEAFVNICRYAYPGARGDVEVNYFSEGGQVVMEIIDSGIPFDITAQELPAITEEIHEREIGGLGCLLIRKLMDRVVYRREDGKNILRFTDPLR